MISIQDLIIPCPLLNSMNLDPLLTVSTIGRIYRAFSVRIPPIHSLDPAHIHPNSMDSSTLLNIIHHPSVT